MKLKNNNMGQKTSNKSGPNKNDYNMGFGHNEADRYKKDIERFTEIAYTDIEVKRLIDKACKMMDAGRTINRQITVDVWWNDNKKK